MNNENGLCLPFKTGGEMLKIKDYVVSDGVLG